MSESSITMTEDGSDLLQNPHTGEILLEEFMKPLAISQNALARPFSFHHAVSTKSLMASVP